ncbi:MAG: tRNA pseudouridine(38-40) synthase TruA [Thermoprotei archaeon]|nr:MAG: tRNA pseudouridine(38-40) synthase TruA [Thermoprotei archaeon]RLF20943.1 MAG: tRNA pseudouridine(38-40) synthase TruA [Thermoprotei archaeon]
MKGRVRVAVKVYYDGRYFNGFQRQPGGNTVENKLIEVLTEMKIFHDLRSARWGYASRTDRGVSAIGQVIAFNTDAAVYDRMMEEGLMWINVRIMPNIMLWAFSRVSNNFDPRRKARMRIYRYVSPYRGEDIESLKIACNVLSGVHDYEFLAKPDSGRSGVREIYISVNRKGEFLIFEIRGRSFYRYLIRKIIGAILAVGRGELDIDELRYHLERKIRLEVKPARPEGLILWDITYDNINFKVDLRSIKYIRGILSKEILDVAYTYGTKTESFEFFSSLS